MRGCATSLRRRPWSAALGLLLAAAPAAAQAPARPVHLVDALQTTLERAPALELARENVNLQAATGRVARGAFDLTLRVGPLFQHSEDLLSGNSFEQETLKRGITEGLARSFRLVAEGLERELRDGRAGFPICPVDTEYNWSLFVVTLPGSGLPVPICRPATDALGASSLVNVNFGEDSTVTDFFRPRVSFDQQGIYETQKRLATIYSVQIGATVLDAHERGLELLNQMAVLARSIEERARLARERLGDMPEYEYTNTASVFGQITKPFGNGSIFQFQGTFDGRAAMFRGKPLDPIFGGRPVTNRYRSRLEAFWVQPLRRGQGADSVRAPERAAARNTEAARFTYEQKAADQALQAALAYFELVAAQESQRLNQQSLSTQRQLLETTIKLAAAGEVATAEVARARARTGDLEVAVLTAHLAVVAARTKLADAMGLTEAEADTLSAADAFPARPADVDLEGLAKEALARRADLKAAAAFRDTARLLATAARADARTRFDLTVSGGFAEIYYGPPFRSLKDELKFLTTEPTDSYLKYFNPAGLGRAFGRKWEPVASINAAFELPFGNRARLGRLAAARAAVTQSEIQLVDASRVVQHAVATYAEEIRRARLEWEQRQEAVIQYETTWDAAQRLRAAGEMTLIDTLLTEQLMTTARLQLVEAKRIYASAVARYRRETGTLVSFDADAQARIALAGLVDAR